MRTETKFCGMLCTIQPRIEEYVEMLKSAKRPHKIIEVTEFKPYVLRGEKTPAGEIIVVHDAPVLNLTQHEATQAQKDDGVFEPNVFDKGIIKALLTFNDIPNTRIINERAEQLTKIAVEYGHDTYVMIGGAPYLMATLETALTKAHLHVVYSFTKRKSVEKTNPDGTVAKTSVFEHVGWIVV